MSEVLLSPGIFMQENDLTIITQGPIAAGAALIGPTVLGPVNIPTVVTSYSDFKNKFGASFVSGGNSYEYLTSMAALNYFEQGGSSLLVTRVASGSYTSATASVNTPTSTASFVLETLSVGTIMNNVGSATSGALASGSVTNVRWEVTSANSGSGLFSLVVRQGDDYTSNKGILETWNNLSLDPNQNNYISYIIGDQAQTVATDEFGNYYLQVTGSYANKSKYVRVKSVNLPTPDYFNALGVAKSEYTASLPAIGSGSVQGAFGGATGPLFGSFGLAALNMFEGIPTAPATSNATNIQGLLNSNYNTAIALLQNQDAFDFNVIYAPGLTAQNSLTQVQNIINLAQNRGDSIAVVDMGAYNQTITTITGLATGFDSSYAATYWPWVQIKSRETGKINFVPASTLIPAIYEYNDKVAAEWFAPAGLNRGSLSAVIQPERKLSVSDRNLLQTGRVNPIAAFSGVGTVVYGQKTLQAKPSALDRVNVRRLLIALKSYIGGIAETIVFEPNTQVTRNKFLNQVNPYLESVQQRQGLYAFQVVMDETNNTPDVIDRNQLVGSVYLQPTRTAEYIYLDFNIMPTGVSFSQ